ncbi:MAG: septal ring lytic transglycosylase RlpA family protein [Pseudomonadota bacterium]|jgi:rare lipoprotein A
MIRTFVPSVRTARPLAILVAATAALTITGGLSDASAKTRKDPMNAQAHAGASTGGRSFSGMASYYGNELAGRRTASGARFNPNGMTAAHRTLPFGTKLRVTHGGRSVIVTINDRGPFVRGRVLDLSKGAAQAIGMTGRGVGRVVAEAM